MTPLDYPLWLRATHFFNFLFLSLLVRSGLEILSAHPRLYWNDHCTPDSEWLKFTKKRRPTDRLWTASDEETSFPPLIALPGHENLGLGRHWHFLVDFAWLLTGLLYVVMLFASPEWRRLIPATWQIVPDAGRALLSYLTLHLVEAPGTYNALQQLTYAAVVFLLAPFSIATGIAMSPAIAARFPWYIKIFHGRQAARSLHFLALCTFILFLIGHVALVVLHGFRKGLAVIVLGETHDPHLTRALVVWLSGLTGILVIHVVTTMCSHRRPRFVQKATQAITDPLRTLLFGHEISAQHYSRADISPYFWVNGRAPKEETYLAMARDHFANYILEAGGLVEKPLRLTLADIRAMPKQTQITKHCCIQGWSGVAEWSGVSLRHIVGLCRLLPEARYIVFYAFDNKSTSEPHAQGPGYFYGTIRRELADDPQTILAYEMNGEPLPIDHGAPLRLRVETQLGFTMVKYIRAIEFVETYAHIGKGQGGWREDYQYFSQEAGI
jgi:DMSO/TMAO reductase YedYZ molybdopterin-dependent catalytic subunit/thiosulfate reductase cytochrome b subunit